MRPYREPLSPDLEKPAKPEHNESPAACTSV
jgi:hypothetical protein